MPLALWSKLASTRNSWSWKFRQGTHTNPRMLPLLFTAVFAVGAPTAWADPLYVKSPPMPEAHQTLLLDLDRAGDRIVAVGQYGVIVYSDDDGLTWSQAEVPAMVTLTGVDFVDAQTGWAVGQAALILKTEDGGATWIRQHDGEMEGSIASTLIARAERSIEEIEARMEQIDPDEDEDAYLEADDELWLAEDRLQIAEKAKYSSLQGVWFKDAKEGYAVGAYAQFYRTTDGGVSWIDWSGSIDNFESHNNAIWGKGDLVFIVGERGNLFRSRDGGKTWNQMESPFERSLYDVFPGENGRVYTVGMVGLISYSDNQGERWTLASVPTEFPILSGYVAANGEAVFVGNNGTFVTERASTSGYHVHLRSDRLHITGIVPTADGHFVISGFGGVKRVTPKGLNEQ